VYESIWDLPAFTHRIVCPLAFSSPPQSATIHTVWLFSEIHSHKRNSAPYRASKVLHACFYLSVQSTLWLRGPAGIIDHPSAHYHTEWRSHSSYETQNDPERRISVLGLISCQKKKKKGSSMMHGQWPHPFPFFTRSEFYRAKKWRIDVHRGESMQILPQWHGECYCFPAVLITTVFARERLINLPESKGTPQCELDDWDETRV